MGGASVTCPLTGAGAASRSSGVSGTGVAVPDVPNLA